MRVDVEVVSVDLADTEMATELLQRWAKWCPGFVLLVSTSDSGDLRRAEK